MAHSVGEFTDSLLSEENMAGVIDLWQHEHGNYGRLLDLLDKEFIVFHGGGSPDYGLMLEVLHYMTDYPDRLHHAQEDLAYDKVAQREARLIPVVKELIEQHRVIINSGTKLVAGLDAVINETMMPRAAIEIQAQTYVGYLRNHMRLEEAELFPALLEHSDCLPTMMSSTDRADPLFGTQTIDRYKAIRKSLDAFI